MDQNQPATYDNSDKRLQQAYSNLLSQQYFNESPHTSPPNSASATGVLPSGWPQSGDDNQQQFHQEQPFRHRLQPQQRTRSRKRERLEDAMAYNRDDKSSIGPSGGSISAPPASTSRASEDAMPSTSDFVKKLYKMLEDPAFQSIVCWGPLGDCFVVKDMNEFTKAILPRMFKHSNFASFVRQLNKYDFHKVKNTDDNQFGEHSWIFRHPDFHADRRDALENIKRKVPTQRKSGIPNTSASAPTAAPTTIPANGQYTSSLSLPEGRRSQSPLSFSQLPQSSSNSYYPHSESSSQQQLLAEIQRLKDESEDLRGRVRTLERNHENVLVEMVGFQRGMAQQDGLMQSLIKYFLGVDGAKLKTSTSSSAQIYTPQLNLNPSANNTNNVNTNALFSPPLDLSNNSGGGGGGGGGGRAPTTNQHNFLKQQIQVHLHAQQEQVQRAQAMLAAASSSNSNVSGGGGSGLDASRQQQQGQGHSPSNKGHGQGMNRGSMQQQQQQQGQGQQGARDRNFNNLSLTLSPSTFTPGSLGLPSPSLGLSDQQNPFLPAHAVQWILSGGGGGGNGSGSSGGMMQDATTMVGMPMGPPPPPPPPPHPPTTEVGRATLVQMSELSRRAAAGEYGFQPSGGDGRLWSGLNFGIGEQGHGQQDQQQQQIQPKMPYSRADALAQIQGMQRERVAQNGWANPAQQPQTQRQPSGLGTRGPSVSRDANFSGERARGEGMNVDVGLGVDEGRRPGRSEMPQGRSRDGAPFYGGVGLGGGGGGGDEDGDDRDDSPMEYVMPSGSIQPFPEAQQPQPQQAQLQQQAQQQQQQQASTPPRSQQPSPNPWASIFNSPGFSMTPSSLNLDESEADLAHEGLQVYTVGHLLPRDAYVEDAQGNWSYNVSGLDGVGDGSTGSASPSSIRAGVGSEQAMQSYPPMPLAEPEEVIIPSTSLGGSMTAPSSSSSSSSSTGLIPTNASASGIQDSDIPGVSKKLRVRRSTFVPGWAVPPRVLLVDDDAVSRRLSSKFLKVFGCTIDVAVDGIGAVNKMNLEKYDLVLMDIVMPKLDGVSATSLIRKFDQGTPIISMTSNSKPNEIMTYYSSGMNDILPKPFTKEGLLDMLEKHLRHLNVLKFPRPVGVPPMSDSNMEQAFLSDANNLLMQRLAGGTSSSSSGNVFGSSNSDNNDTEGSSNQFPLVNDDDDEGRINPLAAMGLTTEMYNLILQNIINGEGALGGYMDNSGSSTAGSESSTTPPAANMMGEKRPLEDGEDGRDGKRSRFEVVE